MDGNSEMKTSITIATDSRLEPIVDLCLNTQWYSSAWFEKCIILRWFDSDTITKFISIKNQEHPSDFLINLPYVEARNQGYAIHDVIREIKYKEISSKSPAHVQKLHTEAAEYYWERLHRTLGLFSQSIVVEYFYHLLRADQNRGINELQKIMSTSRMLQPELYNVLLSTTNGI